jgi:hypothetical protein
VSKFLTFDFLVGEEPNNPKAIDSEHFGGLGVVTFLVRPLVMSSSPVNNVSERWSLAFGFGMAQTQKQKSSLGEEGILPSDDFCGRIRLRPLKM